MDSKYIEQLLERYWQCETSLEEEAQLRAFFTEATFPSICFAIRICSYISNFSRKCIWVRILMPVVLAEVEAPVVKAKRMTLAARFMPLFKAAAVVAVVLSLGNVMQHSFFADVREVAAADTIGKQISAPSVALSGDVPVNAREADIG